jgi:hypothetical protein
VMTWWQGQDEGGPNDLVDRAWKRMPRLEL